MRTYDAQDHRRHVADVRIFVTEGGDQSRVRVTTAAHEIAHGEKAHPPVAVVQIRHTVFVETPVEGEPIANRMKRMFANARQRGVDRIRWCG